jgi:hypothetical protein
MPTEILFQAIQIEIQASTFFSYSYSISRMSIFFFVFDKIPISKKKYKIIL